MPTSGQKYHARVWTATNRAGQDPAGTKHRRRPSALRPARRCWAAAPPTGGAERCTARPERRETVVRTPRNQTRNGFAPLLHPAPRKESRRRSRRPPPVSRPIPHTDETSRRTWHARPTPRSAGRSLSLRRPRFPRSRRRRPPGRAATCGAPCGPRFHTPPAPAPLQGHLPPAGRTLRALAAALPRHGCAAPPPRAARRGWLGAGPTAAFPGRRRPLAARRSPSRPAEPGTSFPFPAPLPPALVAGF